jgi:ABC-type nitrate/sulfonate/bicarbonate transport system substrate-binding protein
MLGPPFSFAAKDKGLKSFGRSSDLIGPYQSGGTYVMRRWASANGALLERYIAAYVESVRMVRDPANRDEVISLIETRFKQDRKTAERSYAALMEPAFGIAPDARFDMKGFEAVLALRAEIEGEWGGRPPSPDKYLDLGYYDRALIRIEAAAR